MSTNVLNSKRKKWFVSYLRSKDIFFIESPFQLICMQSFFEKGGFVFLRPTSENSRSQIVRLIKLYDLEDKLPILLLFSNSKLGKLKDIFTICILFLFNSSSKWHIGYFRAKVSKFILFLLPSKELIYYDDGMATVNIVNREVLEKYKNIRFRTIFFKTLKKYPRVEYNNVRDKSVINGCQLAVKYSGCCVFFGTKLVEGGFITLEEYSAIVKDSIRTLNVSLYIAHRDESDSKLKEITNLGVEVVRLELPIEIAIQTKLLSPKVVVGAATSSLLTTKLLFGGDVFFYSIVNLTKRRKSRLKNTEKVFEENNVVKINI